MCLCVCLCVFLCVLVCVCACVCAGADGGDTSVEGGERHCSGREEVPQRLTGSLGARETGKKNQTNKQNLKC